MFLIYSIIYLIVLCFLLPFEYAKRPPGLRRRWLREKLGGIDIEQAGRHDATVWVHAVSVGEVIAAVPFLKAVKDRHPGLRVILSTVTDTGQAVARERVSAFAEIVYLPFDLPFILNRLLRHIRPDALISVETEIWPNLFRVFRRSGIPVLVMNGRISDGSYRGYLKVRFFMRRVLGLVDALAMQERIYADRAIELGADPAKVLVTGNFKFDIRQPATVPAWAGGLKGPAILCGSTHEGEEEIFLGSYALLRQEFPGLTLIIAPRHPGRFDRAEDLVRSRGFHCLRRSGLTGGVPAGSVVLLDTVGELAALYGACDIAVIGGSFVRHGGHNPLEPAVWGKPILCGPHMENFPLVLDFYREGGARHTDRERLSSDLRSLLMSPEERRLMGEKAMRICGEKAGAVGRCVGILEDHLKLPLALPEKEARP